MPTLRASDLARRMATRHRLSPAKLFALYRKASVPEEGWTDENFTGARARDSKPRLSREWKELSKLRLITTHWCSVFRSLVG
jgi:hypothetical protein